MISSRIRRLFWYLCLSSIIIFIITRIQRYLFKIEQNDSQHRYVQDYDDVNNLTHNNNKKEIQNIKDEMTTNGNDKEDYINILIWTDYFQRKSLWKSVFQRHFSEECEETRCRITQDKNQHHNADAVLFDGNSLELKKYRPKQERFVYPSERKPNQVYIFFSTEPPTVYENVNLEKYNNFFNWTMTYRKDSDVVVPYGLIEKRKARKKIKYPSEDELKSKKFGIFLNTHNCDLKPRADFIKAIERYVAIDKFGRCYNKECGNVARVETEIRIPGEDVCEKNFPNYAFFMAFENSLCKDYVTEKLYRSLKLGIVPVTLGYVNYSEFAPPNSFIDAKDFETENDLIHYLVKVENNVTLYNEYLKWQEHYDIDVGTPYKPLICDLCKQLHSPHSRKKKVYENIKDWLIKEGNCSNIINRNNS